MNWLSDSHLPLPIDQTNFNVFTMLMFGKNLTQVNDPMQEVSVERIYQGLMSPKPEMTDKIRQLRAIKAVDPSAYKKAKTSLPYFVCGQFRPAIRKKENFVVTRLFILDIDKLSQMGMGLREVKEVLKKDEQVHLMFTSPGNDGLKLIFRLKEEIHDSGYFSTFYKLFATDFAKRYHLQGCMDLVTSDVSRCCFMSIDPNAYYKADSLFVDSSVYVKTDDLRVVTLAEKAVKEEQKRRKEIDEIFGDDSKKVSNEPQSLGVLDQIKKRLNPAYKTAEEKKKVYVQPEELVNGIEDLKVHLATIQIEMAEHRPIHYGRAMKLKIPGMWAEVNLFYGKHSFRAVATTKTGSNQEFAVLCAGLIQQYFDENGW